MKALRDIALKVPSIRALYEHKQQLETELIDLQIAQAAKLADIQALRETESRSYKEMQDSLADSHAQIRELEAQMKHVYEGHNGLAETINFLQHRNQDLIDLHDVVVEEKWAGQKGTWLCLAPFTDIEILNNGDVYTCCSAFVKHNHCIGNVYEQTLAEIWNSDKAKKLRYSVSMGNFEYCNRFCMHLKNLDKRHDSLFIRRDPDHYSFESWQDCTLDYWPKKISLSCDHTCNLTCASCRKEVRKNEQSDEEIYNMLMRSIYPYLDDCRLLTALGSGEFFASRTMRRFFEQLSPERFPHLKVGIVTNAQLITPERLEALNNLSTMWGSFYVSIDAAEKETYEKLRTGAKWEKLLESMKILSAMKMRDEIDLLQMNFVVQADNYRQMPDFVELARSWKADCVEFQRILNFGGTYDAEQFKTVDVLNPSHPDYAEVKSIISTIKEKCDDILIIENLIQGE